MKKLIFVMCFAITQFLCALEVERVTFMDLGLAGSNERFNHSREAQVYLKGAPGRLVEIEFPYEVKEKTRNGSVEFERIYAARDQITLDSRGRGNFDIGVSGRTSGSGEVLGRIPFNVKYVD